MKWVALAILLFIAGYTVVMVFFRKPGPPYRPYQDTADRATVTRLLSSGYQRIAIEAQSLGIGERLDVLSGGAAASVGKAPGGLGSELDVAMIQKPLLADSYLSISAPAAMSAAKAYRILAEAQLPDNKRTISSALVFRKGDELSIVPLYEKVEAKLQSRWRENTLLITLPQGSLPAGDYQATLIGAKTSLSWRIHVRQ